MSQSDFYDNECTQPSFSTIEAALAEEDTVMASSPTNTNGSATMHATATNDSTSDTDVASASSPLLTIDEFMRNDVEIASANHQEVKTRPLSSLEQFFVRVHESYQHQTLAKHTQTAHEAAEAEKAAAAAAGSSSVPASAPIAAIAWPFGSMETKLFQARYQIDNIVQICEQLIRASGGATVQSSRNVSAASPAATPQPPQLTLAEKNTEMFETKRKEQLQLQKDHQRSEREAAAANATTEEAQKAIEAAAAQEEEAAEYLADDGDGDEDSLVVSDPNDAHISLETRKKRLGVLLQHKRRQYQNASDILKGGRDQLAKSIEGERKFLHGISHLAKYWTIRTIHTDSNSTQMNQQTPSKGPLFNPYQNGLPAGSTSAYPHLMIDYRIGTLDIGFDRGKAWLYRNDAGDVFLDEAIGKEESIPVKTHIDESKSSTTAKMEIDSLANATAPSTTAVATPSWLNVSQRLHRAQHQLLYKHLYNLLMTEAREWRMTYRREQQVKSSAGHAPLATTTFQPPPAAHASRPWCITEITPRQITIHIAGSQDGVTLHWNRGIGCGFEITNDAEGEIAPQRCSKIPPHLSRTICHQTLSLLLDQTLKNSLGQRPLLELLHSPSTDSVHHRESTAGVAAGGTTQDDSWPARPTSSIQFIVMAITHWRLVHEVRLVLHNRQFPLASSSDSSSPSSSFSSTFTPPFRVVVARTKQPYVYAFTILTASDRFLLEATIRGVHFHVVVPLAPSHPPALTYAQFGQPSPDVDHRVVSLPNLPLIADTIQVTGAQHFDDILSHALQTTSLHR